KTNGVRLQNIIPYGNNYYSKIHSILTDKDGNIWVNVNDGLNKFFYDGQEKKWKSKYYHLNKINDRTDITSLYQDMYGNIWVGTMGKGIIVVDPETGNSRNINEDKLLIDASVLSISGKENEIWISSLAGAIH